MVHMGDGVGGGWGLDLGWDLLRFAPLLCQRFRFQAACVCCL